MAKHSYDDDTVLEHEDGTAFLEDERYSWFEAHRQQYMDILRHDRNKKLSDTDWVVLKSLEEGVPVSDTWKTYRQALRDITEIYEKQSEVVWPTLPE
jgi:IS1 family transposase